MRRKSHIEEKLYQSLLTVLLAQEFRERAVVISESGSRPRRQATEKALSKFESGFSTDEDFPPRNKPLSTSPKKTLKKSSDSTDPRPRRHAREKRSFKIQDDTESEEEIIPKSSSSRKKKPVLPQSETVSEDS